MYDKKYTCADCEAVDVVTDPNQIGVKLYVCRRYPPQPIVLGMTQQGPHIVSLYPQVSEQTPACSECLIDELEGDHPTLDS
jgi:hypothetical protein